MWCLRWAISVSSLARCAVFFISAARFLCSQVPPSVSSSESYAYLISGLSFFSMSAAVIISEAVVYEYCFCGGCFCGGAYEDAVVYDGAAGGCAGGPALGDGPIALFALIAAALALTSATAAAKSDDLL